MMSPPKHISNENSVVADILLPGKQKPTHGNLVTYRFVIEELICYILGSS